MVRMPVLLKFLSPTNIKEVQIHNGITNNMNSKKMDSTHQKIRLYIKSLSGRGERVILQKAQKKNSWTLCRATVSIRGAR